jgi:hypothetical protein
MFHAYFKMTHFTLFKLNIKQMQEWKKIVMNLHKYGKKKNAKSYVFFFVLSGDEFEPFFGFRIFSGRFKNIPGISEFFPRHFKVYFCFNQ